MSLLVVNDVLSVRRISSTYNTDRFNSFAKEAEDVHLRGLLGHALYLDLITNPTKPDYVKLLNGEIYKFNGQNIKFYGLRVYLAYAWLFINATEGDEFQTNSGTMNFNDSANFKKSPDKVTLRKYQDTMIAYKNNAIDYLNTKSGTFPLWLGNNKTLQGSFVFKRV